MELLAVQAWALTLVLFPHTIVMWTDDRAVNILAYRIRANGSIDQSVIVLVNDAIFARFDKANNTFALLPSASAGFSLLEKRESLFCLGEVKKGFYRQAEYLEKLKQDTKPSKQKIEHPSVSVYTEFPEEQGKENIIYCYVTGFYPGDIEINFFLNGQKPMMKVETSDLIYSKEWTFRVYKYMNINPRAGDEYTCEVKHSSMSQPKTTVWRSEFSSSTSHPYWTYALFLGIVLGVMTFILLRWIEAIYCNANTDH